MSAFLTVCVTGVGLGALYFMVGSGLSLIFGLLRVLNVGHAAFLLVGAYAGWAVLTATGGSTWGFLAAMAAALVAGGLAGTVTEVAFIRRLYGHEVSQILLTLGIALATSGLFAAYLGADQQSYAVPGWVGGVVHAGGSAVPAAAFVMMVTAAAAYGALELFLAKTRYGLIVRAGAEDRAMVTALGIDVRRAFTVVFAIGGAVAALAGLLLGIFDEGVDPQLGYSALVLGFVVVVIGGLGSLRGALIAGLVVGLVQQLGDFYLASAIGDLTIVVLMALVLLFRPQGLLGRRALVGRT